jgi:hypothetical protein
VLNLQSAYTTEYTNRNISKQKNLYHFRVLKTFVYSVLLVKLYTVSNNEDLTQYKHIIKQSTYCGRNLMLRFFRKLICLLVHKLMNVRMFSDS